MYLSQLELIPPLGDITAKLLRTASFALMVLALVVGALIILRALWQGHRAHLARHAALEEAGVAD